MGRVREEKRREEERSSKKESLRRKKIQVREKVGKSRNNVFFPMICGSGGSKSKLAKAAGAEPAGQLRDEKLHAFVARSTFASEKDKNTSCSEHLWKLCTPLWREAHFQVKIYKAPQLRSTFRSCDVEKVHVRAVAARSTFPSQNAQKTFIFGPLLEVAMSKKCTCVPLRREAHFEVKMVKAPHVRITFEGSDVVLRGRRRGLCTLSKVSQM